MLLVIGKRVIFRMSYYKKKTTHKKTTHLLMIYDYINIVDLYLIKN